MGRWAARDTDIFSSCWPSLRSSQDPDMKNKVLRRSVMLRSEIFLVTFKTLLMVRSELFLETSNIGMCICYCLKVLFFFEMKHVNFNIFSRRQNDFQIDMVARWRGTKTQQKGHG